MGALQHLHRDPQEGMLMVLTFLPNRSNSNTVFKVDETNFSHVQCIILFAEQILNFLPWKTCHCLRQGDTSGDDYDVIMTQW